MGAGRPADHLRPQALQRRARLPGAAGPRDQPLPARSCASSARSALAERTDEPDDTIAENKPGSLRPPANDDAPEQAERADARRLRNPRETNPGARRIGRRGCPIRSWPRAAASTTSGAIGIRRRQRRRTGRSRARAGRRSGRLEPGLDRLSAGRWRRCRTRRCRPAWCPACRNRCRCWAARSGGSHGRRAPAAGRPR